jgi:hypothetical protein
MYAEFEAEGETQGREKGVTETYHRGPKEYLPEASHTCDAGRGRSCRGDNDETGRVRRRVCCIRSERVLMIRFDVLACQRPKEKGTKEEERREILT